jgi:hypothetical protein
MTYVDPKSSEIKPVEEIPRQGTASFSLELSSSHSGVAFLHSIMELVKQRQGLLSRRKRKETFKA